MSRVRKKKYKSYRDIAKNMGVSEWTIWSIMDVIRLKFESFKPFRLLFENKDMNPEDILTKLEEH